MSYQTSGNVHTVNLYIKILSKTQSLVKSNNQHLLSETHKGKTLIKNGFTLRFIDNSNYIEVGFDCIEVLKKNNIDEKDSDIILELLNRYMHELFPFEFEPVLKRVDLRYDVIIPANERELFWELVTKTSDTAGKLNKDYGKKSSDKGLYYRRTDMQTNSENLRINIYDKESQLKNKNAEISEYEKNVIRFEVQLFNKNLNYQNYKYKIAKDLWNYFSEQSRIRNFNKYIMPILYSGTYYKLNIAKEIIKSCNLGESMKMKLIKLLVKCSESNIDTTRKGYSINTWNKYIQELADLNINPLTIPEESLITKMKNPLAYDINNPIFLNTRRICKYSKSLT